MSEREALRPLFDPPAGGLLLEVLSLACPVTELHPTADFEGFGHYAMIWA